MIKRPLVWLLLAYVLGIILGKFCGIYKVLICGTVLAGTMFVVIMLCLQEQLLHKFKILLKIRKCVSSIFSKEDKILILIPLLVLAGVYNISENIKNINKQEEFVNLIQEKSNNKELNIYGKIEHLEEKDKTYAVYIKTTFERCEERRKSLDIGNKKNIDRKKEKKILILIYIDKEKFNENVIYTGDYIKTTGSIEQFEKASNKGQFDEYEYYVKQKNIICKQYTKEYCIIEKGEKYTNPLYIIKEKLRNILYKTMNKKDAGIVNAMILGDKSDIDEEINDLYRKNGIAHIIAISGLHISIIGVGLQKILKKLGIGIYLNTTICIILISAYGILTGSGVATTRAVIMLIVALSAIFFGRTYDMISALALSVLYIVWKNPNMLYTCSMLMSVLAVCGIAILYPVLLQLFIHKRETIQNKEKIIIDLDSGEIIDKRFIFGICDAYNKILEYIKEMIIASLSINITTVPVMLYFYYEVSIMSVLLNIVVIPLMSLVVGMSIVSCLLGLFSINTARFFAGSVHYILKLYEYICRICGKIPCSSIITGCPSKWIIAVYFVIVIIFAVKKQKKILIFLAFYIVMIFGAKIILEKNDPSIDITVMDVGQGDGIYMELQDDTVIMIDGGSSSKKQIGKYTIIPFLKYNGKRKLDYVIITHSDEDHISGLKEIVQDKSYKIENVILPYINEKDDNYIELEKLVYKAGINIKYIKAGDHITIKDITLECLHPAKNYEISSVNGYSTVLWLKYRNFDMLFTGDLEEDGEKIITDKIKNNGTDIEVLKVAHHGSKNSSTEEFLNCIKPQYSIISCGKNNKYGHPSFETLKRLTDIKSTIFTTVESGAVSIKSNGYEMSITTKK